MPTDQAAKIPAVAEHIRLVTIIDWGSTRLSVLDPLPILNQRSRMSRSPARFHSARTPMRALSPENYQTGSGIICPLPPDWQCGRAIISIRAPLVAVDGLDQRRPAADCVHHWLRSPDVGECNPLWIFLPCKFFLRVQARRMKRSGGSDGGLVTVRNYFEYR